MNTEPPLHNNPITTTTITATTDISVSNLSSKSDDNDEKNDVDNDDEDDKGSADDAAANDEERAAADKAIRLGRKGDPRMHKALEARLLNPAITHVEALIAGGFDIPPDCTNDDAIIDGVTLSQRKNQLSRRLRNARKQQKNDTKVRRRRQLHKTNTSNTTTTTTSSTAADSGIHGTLPDQSNKRMKYDEFGLLGGGAAAAAAAAAAGINISQQLPGLFASPHMQQMMNNPPLSTIAAAQRAALETIQSRAEKQTRRRSSLGTTSSAAATIAQGNCSSNSNNNNNNNAPFFIRPTSIAPGSNNFNILQQQDIPLSGAEAVNASATSSSLTASLLAQQQLEYHRQQLAQLLATTTPATNGHHLPYDPTAMTNYLGIPPFGSAAAFSGLPTGFPPSSDPNNNMNSTSSAAAASGYHTSTQAAALAAAAAAAGINPSAVHPQTLAALAFANNPMLYRGFPFPLAPPNSAASATMNATPAPAAGISSYLNHNFAAQPQQLQDHVENFNLKHAINSSIAELLKKPKPTLTPATAESTATATAGGEINNKSNHSDTNSNLTNSSSKKIDTDSNNNSNNSKKEGEGLRVKRRESSKEALNLFARLGSSRKHRSSASDRKFSLTRIQPAADLTSVLLSDADDDSNDDNDKNVPTGSTQRSEAGPQQQESSQHQGTTESGDVNPTVPAQDGTDVTGQLSINRLKDRSDDDIQPNSITASVKTSEPEENLREAFRDLNSNPQYSILADIDKAKLATFHYKSQNNSALKISMLKAGFEQQQIVDSSSIFIEVALLSLEAEVLRLLDLKKQYDEDNKLQKSIESNPPESFSDI